MMYDLAWRRKLLMMAGMLQCAVVAVQGMYLINGKSPCVHPVEYVDDLPLLKLHHLLSLDRPSQTRSRRL